MGSLLKEMNWFLFPWIIFGIFLFNKYRCKKNQHEHPHTITLSGNGYKLPNTCQQIQSFFNRKIVLWIAFTTSFLLFLILEIYYYEQCPIDPLRYNQIMQVFFANVYALDALKVEYSVTCGTLLYILRGDPFAIWDQDSDLLLIKPDNPSKFVADLTEILTHIGQYTVEYHKHRNLVQVHKGRGHGDIWFYSPKTLSDGTELLEIHDYTIPDSIIRRDVYFPAQSVKYFDTDVAIPNKPDEAAILKFGDNYMTPYYNRYQCIENIFTNKISQFRWFMYIAILISGNLIVFCIQKMDNDHYEKMIGIIKKNLTTVMFATIPTKFINSSLKMLDNQRNGSVKYADVSYQRINLMSKISEDNSDITMTANDSDDNSAY